MIHNVFVSSQNTRPFGRSERSERSSGAASGSERGGGRLADVAAQRRGGAAATRRNAGRIGGGGGERQSGAAESRGGSGAEVGSTSNQLGPWPARTAGTANRPPWRELARTRRKLIESARRGIGPSSPRRGAASRGAAHPHPLARTGSS